MFIGQNEIAFVVHYDRPMADLDETKPFDEKRQYQGRNGQENVPCGCMGFFQYLTEKRKGEKEREVR